jgi:hypothetical protein
MKETIERIQDWYKINCNGDWEHSYGYKIETLDNPGWAIKIDLSETSLDKLEFKREFKNSNNENDWFNIHTENKTLVIYCGPENMKKVFGIFFDELIPKYSDNDFVYEIYLPLKGYGIEIWTPAKSKLVNERIVQITEIEKVEYKRIKVRDVEQINFNQADIESLKINYSVGDILEVTLENVFDGIILTTKNEKEN